jgi:OOP family OmpA-OmpF porin
MSPISKGGIFWNITMIRSLLLLFVFLFSNESFSSDSFGLVNNKRLWSEAVFGLSKSLKENNSNLPAFKVNESYNFGFGYDIISNFSVYSNYHFFDNLDPLGKLDLIGLGIMGKFNIDESVSLYGKLGAAYPLKRYNQYGPVGALGIALVIDLNNNISTKLGIDYYNDIEFDDELSFDVVSLGVGFIYKY